MQLSSWIHAMMTTCQLGYLITRQISSRICWLQYSTLKWKHLAIELLEYPFDIMIDTQKFALSWHETHVIFKPPSTIIGNWWDQSLNASNVFILITCSLFILRDMTSSLNSFQVIECVCQEEWPYEITNYHNLPKNHITIYVHILHLSKHHMYERPKLGSKPF